jgi:ADP-ribose pyrophosphatase
MTVKTVYQGKWMEMKERKVGSTNYEFTSRVGGREAVYIIAETIKGELVLIINHRYTVDNEVLEFPAGMIDDGETPEETAVRELREETGYEGTVTKVYPANLCNAGASDEKIYVVIIKECRQLHAQDLDDNEQISVFPVEKYILEPVVLDFERIGVDISSRLVAYMIGLEEKTHE